MTTITSPTPTPAASPTPTPARMLAQTGIPARAHSDTMARIPLSRIIIVELRKCLDTRAGLWLLASIGIASLLATGAVILFAPTDQFTFSSFTLAIGFPMSVILPMVAILSVTAEWSQRSGLTTFTLVPHRGRILVGKAIAAVCIAVVSMLVAFPVGALGNVIGSGVHGVPTVWDQGPVDLLYMVAGNTVLLMLGFMLGVLIRSSTAALVAYFVYAFVAPTLLTFLAFSQKWFHDAQPWVDPNHSQDALFKGGFGAEQWAQLGVTSAVWLVLPLVVGVVTLLRSEVK